MGYYYNLDDNTEPSKAPQEVNDKAKKLLSGDFMSRISSINRESVAGGIGLGLTGYIFSRLKDKNVFVYTIGGVVIGFVLFNLLFRASGGSKKAKEILDDAKEKSSKSSGGFSTINTPQQQRPTTQPITRPTAQTTVKTDNTISNIKDKLNGIKIS